MQDWAQTFKPERATTACRIKAKVEDDEDLDASQMLLAGKWQWDKNLPGTYSAEISRLKKVQKKLMRQ